MMQTFDFQAVVEKFMNEGPQKLRKKSKFDVYVEIFGGPIRHYLTLKNQRNLEAEYTWSYLSNQDPSYSLGKQVYEVDNGMYFDVCREFGAPTKATRKLIEPFYFIDLPKVAQERRTKSGHIIKWAMIQDEKGEYEYQEFIYPETHACLNVLIQYFLRFDKMYKPFHPTDDVVQTVAKRPIIDMDQLYYVAAFANMTEFEENAAYNYYHNVTDALDDFAEQSLNTFTQKKWYLSQKQGAGSKRKNKNTSGSEETKAEEEAEKAMSIEQRFAEEAKTKSDMMDLIYLLGRAFSQVIKIPPKMNLICE